MARWIVTAAAVVVVAVVGVVLSGCGGGTDSTPATSATNKTLNLNLAQAPVTLDPSTAYDVTTLGFLQNFYVRLTQYATKPGPDGTEEVDQGEAVPYLARSWTISPDGKRYEFKLRDATFNDGSPIDAAAVQYSIERALKMENTGAYVLTNGIPKLFKSIEAPAPDTVVLNLNQPNVDMLEDLATAWGSIVQPDIVEKNGGVKAGGVNEWVSSHIAGGGGPFVLADYKPGTGAELKRNKAFFGEPAVSAGIRANFVTSDVTLALQARNRQADITIDVTPQTAANLSGVSGLKVISNETDGIQRLGMVNSHKPFDDKAVRTALSYAVPYEQVQEKVYRGYGQMMFGPLAPAIPGFDKSLIEPRSYDPEKAKTLLEESGVDLPITAKLAVSTDNALDQQIATIVQGTWRPLGVNVEIVKLSAGDMTAAVVEHKYPLFIHVWSPFVYSPLYDFGMDAVCKAPFNSTQWCNAKAEALFNKAIRTSDPAEVEPMVNEIIRLFNEDAPSISVGVRDMVTVLSDRVESYTFAIQMDMRTWG